MPRVRVRQHVNPLSIKYQKPVNIPNWNSVYNDLEKPIHLDLGSARGKFLLSLAQINPNVNYLGIEIREPLVVEANREAKELELDNLYFLFGNANNYLEQILTSIPRLKLQYVTIQFPDPWFKKRHYKRKIVQDDLVDSLSKHLNPGGIVYLQSDVLSVVEEMCDRFISHPYFQKHYTHTWLESNPLPVATEREKATLARGEAVYRVLLKHELEERQAQALASIC